MTIIHGKGTLPREQAGRNIHYDDASLANYKKVEQGDFIIHLRSFEGGLEMANEDGIVSPAYTILRCKKPHSSLFYEAYFHTDVYKPMQGYNLMQAIARVNRVFRDKEGGLIVDYVGIASALKQAMNDYTVRETFLPATCRY